ncbi:MAG: ABC transporter permease [Candidatus Dormibacteraeota bacterium]|uniref:ABC transporter permease n=1 Tax=Candidatus Dormiibacter inghamiae TaxID=3127013 RepID=A0A934KEI4_9BACT|nr:ABC transporter permease [Candidatus Dormibacteraeota bacterium]MBJ7607087.1 ABC transporter permease [Candidatus Dormibacteraeota bacterium]
MRAALRIAQQAAVPLVAILLGFLVAGVAVAITGADPSQAYLGLFQGAFTNKHAFTESLIASVPYVFLGLAVATGFRAGLFNIGADGQFYLGALGGVFVGFSIHGLPGIVHIPLAILAGVACGAVYGGLPGFLKARFGAHEVITTIMLNYIAYSLSDYLINRGPLGDPHSSAPKTPFIDPSAQLPIIFADSRLHLGLLLALLAVPLMWFLIERTTIGFRIRAVGLSPEAARSSGISVARTMVLVMAISGGLAGLAGADEVLGVSHFMPPSFSIGYGFDAIAVALLARSNPWGILPAAFLFGAMRNGAGFMQLQTQVSADMISIVQATVIMFVAAPVIVRWLLRLREVPAESLQITQPEGVGAAPKT